MPYIKKDDGRREALRNGAFALTAGELNYQIFYYVKRFGFTVSGLDVNRCAIRAYVEQFLGDKPNYQRYNDMTGCLIRCGKEIVRRLGKRYLSYELLLLNILTSYDEEIAKYEDIKIESNGDVE